MRGAWPAEPAIPRSGPETMSFSLPGEPEYIKQALPQGNIVLDDFILSLCSEEQRVSLL